jgi:hypothetical protein
VNYVEPKKVKLKVPKESRDELFFRLSVKGFKRIADKLELLWGSAQIDDYFVQLIIDYRGDREGFPKDVLSIVLQLFILHNESNHE